MPAELKSALLVELVRSGEIRSVIAFTRTKHRANRLADYLAKNGVAAGRIHGNRSQAQRTEALGGFKAGKFPVLVATDIAARGIDVEELSHVINFDVPASPEDYVHRVGRTARAEAKGDAFLFVSPEEEADVRGIERAIGKRLPRVTRPWLRLRPATGREARGAAPGAPRQDARRAVRRPSSVFWRPSGSAAELWIRPRAGGWRRLRSPAASQRLRPLAAEWLPGSAARAPAGIPLVRDLGLDEQRQESERFLPAEIAGLGRNDVGHPFLHDAQLGPDGHLLQAHRHLKLPRQVRIVEMVRVANAFVRNQLEVLATEGVAAPVLKFVNDIL